MNFVTISMISLYMYIVFIEGRKVENSVLANCVTLSKYCINKNKKKYIRTPHRGGFRRGSGDSVEPHPPFTQNFFCMRNLNLNYITKTCLYNFDSLKPHFYIIKLGFTGLYIIFPPRRF